MGFLSSIFKNNRRNVRDLLLNDTGNALPVANREALVAELVQLLNQVEHINHVAASSELIDTILLRRKNDPKKVAKCLAKGKQKPFVFLINLN
jgi:hypothetical protein